MHKQERRRPKADCIRAAGFTLVELLVVVAIVGILAALLVGGVSRSKKSSQGAACQNNLRQIGLGFGQFVQTFSEYPLGINEKGLKEGLYQHHGLDWYEALNLNAFDAPFAGRRSDGIIKIPTTGVWDCPASDRPASWDDDPRKKGNLWVDYGYNEFGLGNHDNAYLGLGRVSDASNVVGYRPTSESELRSPADMIEAGDGISGWEAQYLDGLDQIAVTKRIMSLQDSTGTARSLSRHNGRANVVFCDGHVESIKLRALFTVQSSDALVRWNKDHKPHPEMLY